MRTRTLKFVPLAVADNTRRVWIAHGSGSAEVEVPASNYLPGGVLAANLLPLYPAVEDDLMELPDGWLCVPVEYNNGVAGSVVLWRLGTPRPWSFADIARVRAVARSIAIAAVLDGNMAARARATDHTRELLDHVRSTLGAATHQMNQISCALSALVTFGQVLLRRLEPGNPLRTLAKSILVEARPLDDLMIPLDRVKTGLVTEGTARSVNDDGDVKELQTDERGAEEKLGIGTLDHEKDSAANSDLDEMFRNLESSFIVVDDEEEEEFDKIENESPQELEIKEEARVAWERAVGDDSWIDLDNEAWVIPDKEICTNNYSPGELLWLSDVAAPVAENAEILADEAGITFSVHIDNCPGIFACVDDVRGSHLQSRT